MPSQSNTVTVILNTYTDPFNLTLIQAYMYTLFDTGVPFRSPNQLSYEQSGNCKSPVLTDGQANQYIINRQE